ncbi:MAG: thioredoxin family protein [Verrucomicrobiota bacterium]|nr:thioredoxin family protein [Verrucomicrobiota bacterium]
MSARLFARLAVLAAVIGGFFPQTSRGQMYEGRELVRAELISDGTAVVPGKTFTVGLLLRMVPHWHTYWKFPGDAGIPTELKWQLPPGWKAGEIQWPIPLKIVEQGDIEIYGYHDEVLLMQEITPPASIDGAKVKLAAEASWLVCEKICIPGSRTVEIELPVAGSAAPANEEVFGRYRRALPQAWPAADVAEKKWSRTESELTLHVRSSVLAGYPAVAFYPLPAEGVVITHPATEQTADGVTFHVPLESADAGVQSMDGIVVFGQAPEGPERNAWQVSSASAEGAAAAAPTRDGGYRAAGQPQRGLAMFLLFGFIGGLILNLMPCVLPVISLKLFGFIQQAGKSRAKIFRSGVAFSAGIFTWFVALALVLIGLKAAGHEIAWALQFTNPYFVVGMSALVLVFALNLFGVFEITLPGGASTGIVAWASREGDAGSFLHGVFATVLATPCTAPFLGAALGFAFTQSGAIILLMFVAIAAGMSAPYLALCAHPAWLRFLPKPGAWMVHVKHFMGFLMMATLLFLIAVLGAQRGVDGVVWTSCFLLLLSVACWMYGAFNTPARSTGTRALVLVLAAALVVGSGVYFIGGKFQHTRMETAGAVEEGWRAFTPEALATELAQGHAVFVDFTAAWCVTCKFNEKTVLETAAVRAAFDERRVVKFKADWTNADPAITRMLKQFGRPGVPLYVLYPAGNSVEPIVLPELLTKNIVLDQLQTIVPRVAAAP